MLQYVDSYPFVIFHDFSEFLPPKNRHYDLTKDYSLGGKIISLENQDKNTHIYCAETRNDKEIWFWREDKGIDTAELKYIASKPIRQLSLALDQLNLPQFSFTLDDGASYIYWFNESGWELTPISYHNPKLILDCVLKEEAPISDICCIASKEGGLYVSYQRNSYSEWVKLADHSYKNLVWRVGHTNDGRIGIMWR